MNRALGIDTSEWDLFPLDWSRAQEILSFAFIKISQGTNPDPLFRAQWEAAEGYVLRGLYHMLDPFDPVSESVEKTIELYSKVSPGELPPALDLELGDVKRELPRALLWLEQWENKTGKRPILYTSKGFLNGEELKPENRWLSRYTLWRASWPYDEESEDLRRELIRKVLRGERLLPYPAFIPPWVSPPDWHQWTSRGEPEDIPGYYMGPGHKKAVDFNFYHGTKEDLFLRFGEPKKRPGGVIMPSIYKYSITPTSSSGSKVRLDHYVIEDPPNRISSLSFGRFAFGDEVWIAPDDGNPRYKAGDTWLRVKSVDGSPLDGWIAAIHNGVRYGRIDPLGTGGEPETPTSSFDVNLNIEADSTPQGLTLKVTASSPGHAPGSASFTLPKE